MVPTLVLAAWVGGLVLLAWVGQRRVLYFPSDVVPARAPTGVEEVVLTTSDGLGLDAWFVPTDVAPRSTVVVLHGNGGNRTGRLPLGRQLAAAGHEVLLVDYRGYGGNPGRPDHAGLARDAAAARAWVAARPAVDTTPVVLLGESLGGAVAVESAARQRPDAVVLRSPFSSLADIARHHYHVPSWFLRDRWSNVDAVPALDDLPVLGVLGSDDHIVPPDQSRRVSEAAAHGHLVEVEGAGHNDRALLDGEQVVDAIATFLDNHLPTDDD